MVHSLALGDWPFMVRSPRLNRVPVMPNIFDPVAPTHPPQTHHPRGAARPPSACPAPPPPPPPPNQGHPSSGRPHPHPHRFDDAPGVVGIDRQELPAMPDDILQHPEKGRVDPRRWFAAPERPLEIEIGSGKGTFILAQARANPQTNLLGIETEG